VRTFSVAALDIVEPRFTAIAQHTAAAHGASCEVEFLRRAPPVINTPFEAEFAAQVMRGIVGEDCVVAQEPSMPSEDFAFMLQAMPGAYVFMGNGDGQHRLAGHGLGPCMLHNPSYDFNDELIPLGATYWVRLAQQWLATPRRVGAR
jgi:metal-dependent amidase/aminoacylase/carboxypeptidase family protein